MSNAGRCASHASLFHYRVIVICFRSRLTLASSTKFGINPNSLVRTSKVRRVKEVTMKRRGTARQRGIGVRRDRKRRRLPHLGIWRVREGERPEALEGEEEATWSLGGSSNGRLPRILRSYVLPFFKVRNSEDLRNSITLHESRRLGHVLGQNNSLETPY